MKFFLLIALVAIITACSPDEEKTAEGFTYTITRTLPSFITDDYGVIRKHVGCANLKGDLFIYEVRTFSKNERNFLVRYFAVVPNSKVDKMVIWASVLDNVNADGDRTDYIYRPQENVWRIFKNIEDGVSKSNEEYMENYMQKQILETTSLFSVNEWPPCETM